MSDLEEHHVTGSETCVFAFASGDTSRFEWGGTLSHLCVSYVLVRDSTHRWYAQGVAGVGDFHGTVARIRSIAEPYGTTIALGLSTGSYGALLYAVHAQIDKVIAISPVTGKDADVHPDIPSHHHHRVKHYDGDPLFDDLKPLYRRAKAAGMNPTVLTFVSDGRGCEIDYEMAARIGPAKIFSFLGHSHDGLAAYMRDEGIIRSLICDE